jgi:hypothetical protein
MKRAAERSGRRTGLQMFGRNPVDMVLLDYLMLGMDGERSREKSSVSDRACPSSRFRPARWRMRFATASITFFPRKKGLPYC